MPPPSVGASGPRPKRASSSQNLPPGAVVGGRYEVVGVLGKGGFGVVYDARHVELGTPVAVKLLRSEMTEDERLFGRFQQEARASAAIGHENIVQVFDLGQDEHGAYIAMEKLEGEELEGRIGRDHPLSEALVARVGAQVADAIAAAHERGVIHRDLKPQNVFLAQAGRRGEVAKVIDFGIAKLLHPAQGDLTKTGQLFGTPRYMAPEQLQATSKVDARVDVYAIGAMLYRALTNAYPHDAETYPELLLQIVADAPPPIVQYRPDVTEIMVGIVAKAMAKRPDDRFRSAGELAETLYAHADALEGRVASVPHLAPFAPPEVSRSGDTRPPPDAELLPVAPARSLAPPPVLAAIAMLALALAGVGVGALTYWIAESEASDVSAHPSAPATFDVHVTAEPASAELVLDGHTAARGRLEESFEVDGTPHTLQVRADGYATETLEFRDAPPPRAHVELLPVARAASEASAEHSESQDPRLNEGTGDSVDDEPLRGADDGEVEVSPSGPRDRSRSSDGRSRRRIGGGATGGRGPSARRNAHAGGRPEPTSEIPRTASPRGRPVGSTGPSGQPAAPRDQMYADEY